MSECGTVTSCYLKSGKFKCTFGKHGLNAEEVECVQLVSTKSIQNSHLTGYHYISTHKIHEMLAIKVLTCDQPCWLKVVS